jgi:hypothetical protein
MSSQTIHSESESRLWIDNNMRALNICNIPIPMDVDVYPNFFTIPGFCLIRSLNSNR